MLLVANRKNLKQYAKDILDNGYTPEKERELINICTKDNYVNYLNSPSEDDSFGITRYLEKINILLNTYGVESCYPDIPSLYYCNAGNSYNTTILHYKGKLYIGDWGSIVEKQG